MSPIAWSTRLSALLSASREGGGPAQRPILVTGGVVVLALGTTMGWSVAVAVQLVAMLYGLLHRYARNKPESKPPQPVGWRHIATGPGLWQPACSLFSISQRWSWPGIHGA